MPLTAIKRFIQSTCGFVLIAVALVAGNIIPSFSADLQKFSDVKLVSDPGNDGDSFLVEADTRTFRVRLYFVDCPETLAASKSDAERVREQTRYFGLAFSTWTIHFGNEAKTFTENALSRPFTLNTAFASALGRSANGRVYGFVTTDGGDDLAELLVKNGFARARGFGRETPDGVSSNEMTARLRDTEISAMLKRVGIWAQSNPDRLAELRAKQRTEDRELQEVQASVTKAKSPKGLIDLNTAGEEELRSVRGIGPVFAKRIIAGRPYKTVDDLLKVKGISSKKLENFRSYFTIGK